MSEVRIVNMEESGENRPFAAHGHATLATAGGLTVLKGVFGPGWRWSTDVKPIAGTDSCQTRHLGYVVSGRMQGKMDDGTDFDVTAGDLFDLQPGHDAWVVGDEPCEVLDYSTDATHYAGGRAADVADPSDAAMNAVRKGYEAFNAGDMETLASLMAREVVHHVPGHGPLSGDHKGLDGVLDYYRRLGELTGGTARAYLLDVQGDHHGHALAVHQLTATRNGNTRVSRGSLLFTFIGDKITDIFQLSSDVPGDDAFLS